MRTAFALVLSIALASTLRPPDPYLAVITTIIVTQSGIKDFWQTSRRRLLGTLLEVILGAIQIICLSNNLFGFEISMLLLGLLCSALQLHPSAYRFGGIDVTIVVNASNLDQLWFTALVGFLDVALGIGVAICLVHWWLDPIVVTEKRRP
ncbi:FUSC family protein [Prochlorococcus marinus]|uniref:FUSC family protein n=1 Tax=Prochlorococcus marinus TaxID=1219 RepID=UPI0022870CC7|nr:FUSC family protein [Prochlorococcus marinus]